MFLVAEVTSTFDKFTRPERVKILILDASIMRRSRSKNVELLARVFDHVEHNFQKGFTVLTDELFYMLCGDVQDMDLTTALQSLMTLFANITKTLFAEITKLIKGKVAERMSSQSLFVQTLFGDFRW